jgi:hypothetical protein
LGFGEKKMIVSKQKSKDRILEYLENDASVFVLGCNGCAQSSGTGGPEQVKEMTQTLTETGKQVTGSMVVDFLCEKALVKSRLRGRIKDVNSADSILVMTCGIGTQAVAAASKKVCHPACDTIFWGGSRGEWRGMERCFECGDCVLDYTGGICPLTACSKSLVNGACGGASHGKCELDKEKDCGWVLIYNRLSELGQLSKLAIYIEPKDFSKRMAYGKDMKTARWALEQTG